MCRGRGTTRDIPASFDDQVAWLATQTSKTAVTQLMRIAWRTVGAIVQRVCADVDAVTDRLAGLGRVGIDEVSYKKGQKYLTVVVDHDSGNLVWASRAVTARPSPGSSTPSAPIAPARSPTCRPMAPAGSAAWCATGLRRR